MRCKKLHDAQRAEELEQSLAELQKKVNDAAHTKKVYFHILQRTKVRVGRYKARWIYAVCILRIHGSCTAENWFALLQLEKDMVCQKNLLLQGRLKSLALELKEGTRSLECVTFNQEYYRPFIKRCAFTRFVKVQTCSRFVCFCTGNSKGHGIEQYAIWSRLNRLVLHTSYNSSASMWHKYAKLPVFVNLCTPVFLGAGSGAACARARTQRNGWGNQTEKRSSREAVGRPLDNYIIRLQQKALSSLSILQKFTFWDGAGIKNQARHKALEIVFSLWSANLQAAPCRLAAINCAWCCRRGSFCIVWAVAENVVRWEVDCKLIAKNECWERGEMAVQRRHVSKDPWGDGTFGVTKTADVEKEYQ